MKNKIYVSMTDTFMSGWGLSEGKINKLIFECDNYEEVMIVLNNAKNRKEMKYIKVHEKIPKNKENKYFIQIKNKNVYPDWYKING